MKRVLGIMWVFLFFVSLLTSVKKLDHYSKNYENCANAWRADLSRAAERPDLKNDLEAELNRGKILTPSGLACPKLLPTHEKQISKRLAAIK